MREIEYDQLLDAVRTAVAAKPGEQKAVNDNQLSWSFIPFPEGWYGVG